MIAAKVKLWGNVIGAVSIDENFKFVYFKYDDDFALSGIEVSPIWMPLSNEIYQFKALAYETFKGLPGMLADSLPDRYGENLISAWLDKEGRPRESFNIIEKLCYIGKRGMGALEFHPVVENELNKVEHIELKKLVELSNEIISQKEKIKAKEISDITQIIKVGTSAGGARAKAIIAYNEDKDIIKSGQLDAGKGYTYWLIKLDGVDQKEITSFTRREYAYYLMAKAAGIDMSESRLLEKDGYYHFMTKRFDRYIDQSGKMQKIHMQTLSALTHIDYNEPGALSYEETTNIMYQMKIKQSENIKLFRRMVFNVMAKNCDDHIKNISFLMNKKGQWRLSPAYDITYAYNPSGKWTNMHQMTINGKRENIQKEDLLQSAKNMKVKEKDAVSIIEDVKKALSQWKTYAKKAHLSTTEITTIEKYFTIY